MGRGASVLLTKTVIDRLERPASGKTRTWDTKLPGLHVRTMPSGKKAYYLKYRSKSGRSIDYKIGNFPEMLPEQARQIARELKVRVSKGEDPAEDRRAARSADTVASFASRFLSEHVDRKLKKSTAAEYRRLCEKYIIPKFGNRILTELTHAHVQDFHSCIKSSRTANFAIAVFRSMMSHAVSVGLIPPGTNPAMGVKLNPERSRNRHLSADEIARLWQVMDEETRSQDVVTAIRLALMTGRRRGEILGMRWQDIDFGRKQLRLADSKVGPYVFNLSSSTVEMLSRLKSDRDAEGDDNPYVVRGRKPNSPLTNIETGWRRIRSKAGLDDVRFHDFRHTYASIAANEGCDLLTLKGLLGHKSIQTTTRYAHLADKTLKSRTEEVGSVIAALVGNPAGSVTSTNVEEN